MIQYILVREDLPVGVASAMVAHAAAESVAQWILKEDYYPTAKLPSPLSTVVVLAAKDEKAIVKWHKKLTRMNIKHIMFCEPDAPYNGAAMSIGCLPADDEDGYRQKAFRRLELYAKTETSKGEDPCCCYGPCCFEHNNHE